MKEKNNSRQIIIKKEELEELYTGRGWSTRRIAEQYGVSQSTILRRLNEYDINKDFSSLIENVNDVVLSPLEQELLKQIKKQGINEQDLGTVIKNLKSIDPKKYRPKVIDFNDKHLRYGYFADAHMGSSFYRPDVMDDLVHMFKKEGVEFVINVGDTLEGMSNREGHIFELDHVGMSAQMKFFEEEFKKLSAFKVYSIEAQSSHGGWSNNKSNQGFNIGEELSMRAPNYEFVGFDEQDLILDNGLKLRLRHPGGGTAYALSYKAQKYIESIGGGNKPDILHTGHFHKYCKLFYRNIHSIDSATLQNQSPFMKKIGTPAHVGYGIVDVYMKKNGKGVERLTDTFFPYYD